MEWPNGIKFMKYVIINFIILVVSILLFALNLQNSKIQSLAVGQGWYMIFEYNIKNDSFIIDFGYMTIVVPIILSLLIYLIKNIKRFNKKKLK